jgi:hypothetical protein
MRFSRSTLQVATLAGWINPRLARVRVAANLSVGLGDERNNCRTSEQSATYPFAIDRGTNQQSILSAER